jgi:hypothetical protein
VDPEFTLTPEQLAGVAASRWWRRQSDIRFVSVVGPPRAQWWM